MTPFVYIVNGETGPERRRPASSLAAFGGRAPGRVLGREELDLEVSSATREARAQPAGCGLRTAEIWEDACGLGRAQLRTLSRT